MSGLDEVFERTLPSLLKRRQRADPEDDAVIGFIATGAPETGAWVVRLRERIGRRTTTEDRPDVVVEAAASVIALLLAGALDIDRAIASGALTVRGDRTALTKLVQHL